MIKESSLVKEIEQRYGIEIEMSTFFGEEDILVHFEDENIKRADAACAETGEVDYYHLGLMLRLLAEDFPGGPKCAVIERGC